MMKSKKSRARALSVVLAIALVASAVTIGVMSSADDAAAVEWSSLSPRLNAARPAAVKVAVPDTVVIQTKSWPKMMTAIPERVPTASTGGSSGTNTGTTTKTTTSPSTTTSTSELAQAQSILAGLIAKYPILKGSTVTIGATPNNYQAVCYYKTGKIVISPTHTSSLATILNHEVWHIIDWRDNGVIDWGESVPR